MKAYTDIEQSKKLAEILPIESADMPYYYDKDNDVEIPCWSLSSLLEQLDDNIADDDGNDWQLEINKEDGQYYLNYHDRWGDEDDIETDYYDDLIDACYEMLLKLYERKML